MDKYTSLANYSGSKRRKSNTCSPTCQQRILLLRSTWITAASLVCKNSTPWPEHKPDRGTIMRWMALPTTGRASFWLASNGDLFIRSKQCDRHIHIRKITHSSYFLALAIPYLIDDELVKGNIYCCLVWSCRLGLLRVGDERGLIHARLCYLHFLVLYRWLARSRAFNWIWWDAWRCRLRICKPWTLFLKAFSIDSWKDEENHAGRPHFHLNSYCMYLGRSLWEKGKHS